MLTRMLFGLPTIALLALFSSNAGAQAPAAPDKTAQNTMICREGANVMEFALDGKGHAKLKRIDGPAVAFFPDLHEPDWTVKVVREEGVPLLQIANARGVLLSMYVPVTGETVGRMTWNNPPGSKADILCDLKTVR